jgi:hyperosmotically inducible protein
MKKTLPKLACAACLAVLAACAQPGPSSPPASSASPVTLDSTGRVTRLRAERNQDDSLGRAVLGALRGNDSGAFKGVSALAWDGAVLLAGAVAKPEQRRRAETLAKEAGARSVHNELVLDENPAQPAFVPDVAREQKIYAALLGRQDVTGAYVVRMVNGVVTLLGSAVSLDDVARAMDAVRGMDDVKWVVNRVSTPPAGG